MTAGTEPTSSSSLDLHDGKPPMLHTQADGDAPGWAAANRAALRAMVAEHGSILVRGLGLSKRSEVGAVFRHLAGDLMIEKEAFDVRRVHSEGVYAASNWAPNQQMCSHHELSYGCEVPGFMMFACLSGPTAGGSSVRRTASTFTTPTPPGPTAATPRTTSRARTT